MPVVTIYNNKGGEGKSTVTIGLAEFLSGNRDRSVLVIDLDAQASSSCSLLGHATINAAIDGGQTVVDLVTAIRRSRAPVPDLDKYLVWRPATNARGSALAELAVLIPNGAKLFDLEEQMNWRKDHSLFRDYLKPALERFDFVLIDMPANVTKAMVVRINALAMSDFILIPVQSTHISLNALPQTFEMIQYAQEINGNGRPGVIGILRNATDKRFQQYRALFPPILNASKGGELPPVFDNHWPPSPAFQTATDESRESRTLKERFGDSYDHARKVARELEQRCTEYRFARPDAPVRRSIWQRLGLA